MERFQSYFKVPIGEQTFSRKKCQKIDINLPWTNIKLPCYLVNEIVMNNQMDFVLHLHRASYFSSNLLVSLYMQQKRRRQGILSEDMIIWCNIQVIINPSNEEKLRLKKSTTQCINLEYTVHVIKVITCRNEVDNGLFITLVPKVYNNVFVFVSLTNFRFIGWFFKLSF